MTTIRAVNQHLPPLSYFKRFYRLHEWTGAFPNDIQTLECVWADYDDNGECTGIYDYAYGEAKQKHHFYGEGQTVYVTGIVENWMNYEITRNEACRQIRDAIIAAQKEANEPPKSIAGLIPLSVYAKLNGITPATARQKAIRGGWKTAVKVGRDWFIDPDEPHTDLRFSKTPR